MLRFPSATGNCLSCFRQWLGPRPEVCSRRYEFAKPKHVMRNVRITTRCIRPARLLTYLYVPCCIDFLHCIEAPLGILHRIVIGNSLYWYIFDKITIIYLLMPHSLIEPMISANLNDEIKRKNIISSDLLFLILIFIHISFSSVIDSSLSGGTGSMLGATAPVTPLIHTPTHTHTATQLNHLPPTPPPLPSLSLSTPRTTQAHPRP